MREAAFFLLLAGGLIPDPVVGWGGGRGYGGWEETGDEIVE